MTIAIVFVCGSRNLHGNQTEYRRRYFRVRGSEDRLLPGEAVCPASSEWAASGKVSRQCAECGQCNGTRSSTRDRVIVEHGFRENTPKQPRLPLWPQWRSDEARV